MEERRKDRSQSGQILILLVLALVGILGFTALAIDGSMVYSDRRIAQNGADAASISGAQAVTEDLLALGENGSYLNWDCYTLQAQGVLTTGNTAAITHAAKVDFTIDDDISDNNGVNTQCFEVDNGAYIDRYIDVSVGIHDETQTSFLHLIFDGPVRNQVEVKTRIFPATEASLGATLHALNQDPPDDKDGIKVGGGPKIYIETGGIISDSDLLFGGTPGYVTVTNGTIVSVEEASFQGNKPVYPTPITITQPLGDPGIPSPADECDGLDYHGSPSDTGDNIEPGQYDEIRINSGSLVMNHGLYCVDEEFTINGVSLEGIGVTIYMKNGAFTINGGVAVTLTAPIRHPDDKNQCLSGLCPPAIPGVLLYVDQANSNRVTINGNSESTFGGTIYAPSSEVQINGTADTDDETGELLPVNMGIQVIADTIEILGNAVLVFNYTNEDIWLGDIHYEIAR